MKQGSWSLGMNTYHPLSCMIYYIGAAAFAFLFQNPLYAAASLAGALALTLLQGLWSGRRRELRAYTVIACFTLIFNPLFSHRGSHLLFDLWDRPITLEAVLFGITAALSLLAVLVLFVSVQTVLTADKWMYLFHSLLPKLSMLLSMALRSYWLLLLRIRQIAAVQRTRGVSPLHGPLRKRMKDGVLLLQVLLAWTLEEGLETADSMKARGYGSGVRTHYWPYSWRRRDIQLLASVGLLGLLILCGWLAGLGRYQVYPELGEFRWSAGEMLEYAAYAAYIAVPLAVEGWEKLQWRYLN